MTFNYLGEYKDLVDGVLRNEVFGQSWLLVSLIFCSSFYIRYLSEYCISYFLEQNIPKYKLQKTLDREIYTLVVLCSCTMI